jgi:hypothetical protein
MQLHLQHMLKIISLVCVLLIYCSLPYVQHAVQYHADAVHVTTSVANSVLLITRYFKIFH